MILHKERMGKMVNMASFKTLSRHLPGMMTEEKHKTLALSKIQADSM
jgi:hypothetical protein